MNRMSLSVLGLLLVVGVSLGGCAKTPAAQNNAMQEFEVVSTKRVEQAESTYNRTAFQNDSTGLVVLLKRSSSETVMVHSTDFTLAFESDSGIPRRPCIGLSQGMKTADEEIYWSSIGGSVSRYWIKEGEQFFAVLFSVPKQGVTSFELQRSITFSPPFEG